MKVGFVPSWYPTVDDPIRGIFFERHVQALRLEHDVRVFSPKRGAPLVAFSAHVIRELLRFKPEIIHAHVAVPAGLASLIARPFTAPVVLTEHSGPLSRLFGASPIRRRVVRRIFDAVDSLAAPSPTLARELRELGVERAVHVIPNPLGDLPDPRAPTPLTFVTVALMDDRTKGLEHLLRAWANFSREQPEALLRIVGDGSLAATFQQLATHLGGRVEWLGALPPRQTLDVVAEADAYVGASVHESFGAALVEAAGLGLPLVATSVGVAPELIQTASGILVRPGDDTDLLRGLREFIARHGTFDRVRIRDDALSRYGPEAVCRITTAVYDEVMAGRR